MPNLILEHVSLTYPQKKKVPFPALKDVNLTFSDGGFHVILGPSGSGKTSLLKCLLSEVDYEGGIALNDIDLSRLTLPERNLSYVSQNYVLYPHLTVFDNIAFPLKMMGVKREEIIDRVEALASSLDLSLLLGRRIKQLSGGQQQRVALARALIKKPSLILFDEPLSNLDEPERLSARSLLKKMVVSSGATSLYVTHDVEEALALADDIVVLKKGSVLLQGTPQEIYRSPEKEIHEMISSSDL